MRILLLLIGLQFTFGGIITFTTQPTHTSQVRLIGNDYDNDIELFNGRQVAVKNGKYSIIIKKAQTPSYCFVPLYGSYIEPAHHVDPDIVAYNFDRIEGYYPVETKVINVNGDIDVSVSIPDAFIVTGRRRVESNFMERQAKVDKR